ncbi:hypothetical protein MTO96_048602 [Rhipicephalus appendiculatus]
MDEFSCHGGLIVDEMKLSEHLSVNSEGRIDGFVDLGQFTSDKDMHSVCDHGMVIMFVPFVGKWTQILAAFATHGNVNGDLLTKIMLEAVILAEKAGLRVDFITSDGATWNRKMWSLMGVKASPTETKCSTLHPVDPTRKLHFLSDFPHLIKCLRNGLLRSDYETPDGRVSLKFIRKALALDGCSVTLQAMHGITGSHTNPNNFEKMRVSLAFQLFGEKVLHGLQLYKSGIEDTCGDITATLKFFKMIHDLVQIMTSRFPAEALRPNSASVQKLRSFQEYLSSWENHTKGQKGFLSQSTAAGLRVTVSSVLSLLEYLTEKQGYSFFMTSRVSQDPVEHIFGIVRQSSGCNTHPTPQQFIVTINCLSFNNLAHSVSKGNCEPAVLHALLPANSGAENVPSAGGSPGPDPVFTSLDNANLMGVLCFSVILGLVLSAFRDEQNVVLHVFVCLSNTLMTATHMLLWFAPIGLCSASVSLVLQGAAELQALTGDLSMYVMAFLAAVSLHGLLVLPTLYLLLTRHQLGPFFRNMVYPLSVALGTSSSSATAPTLIVAMEQGLRMDPRLARFLAPVGATMNMDGTAIYFIVTVLFFAQKNNIAFTFEQHLVVGLMCCLATLSTSPSPQAGRVVLVYLMTSLGIPLDGVGILLYTDWIILHQ